MKTQFERENLAGNLPDAYRKDSGSNNYKILAVEKSEMDRIRQNHAALLDSLDLDKAAGHTLDLYGEMVGQERGAATDEQYRVMLKAKIRRNLANGDFNSILNAISATFGCQPSEISLVEEDQPCSVRIDSLPFEALNASNIDAHTAVQIIGRLMPVGVKLDSLNFSGTFEFGGSEMEYDAEKGFADQEQTIGGYLGYVSTGEVLLPV